MGDYPNQPAVNSIKHEDGVLLVRRTNGKVEEVPLGSTPKRGRLILSAPNVAFGAGAHVTHEWDTLVHKSSADVDDWLEWVAGRVNVLEEGTYSVACQVNAGHGGITDGEHQLKLYCRHATKPDLSLVTRIPTTEAGGSGDTYYDEVLPAQFLEAGYYIYARSNWNYITPGNPNGSAQLIVNRLN